MDLSNKSLALLLVAAIVVSLGGTLISLNKLNQGFTGYASGIVSLSINQSADCVVNTNVSFGTAAQPSATALVSTDSANAYGFNNCTAPLTCTGMHINNTGNVHLNVTYASSVDATGFLVSQTGLGASDFIYYTRNGTYTGSNEGCRINNNTNGNVGTTTTLICQNLSYTDDADMLTMEFNVTVEPDITPGAKSATITITCAQN